MKTFMFKDLNDYMRALKASTAMGELKEGEATLLILFLDALAEATAAKVPDDFLEKVRILAPILEEVLNLPGKSHLFTTEVVRFEKEVASIAKRACKEIAGGL